MNSVEKKLLKTLFESGDGLFLFTLYRRLNTSPKNLYLASESLKKKHLVEEKNERFSLTDEGKEFIIRENLGINISKNTYKNIPEEFIGNKIQINEFYLPISTDIVNDLQT